MTDSCEQWYVELSLGPVLGPMGREDLAALVHSSGVLANDRIRRSDSERWQAASEIDGLFPDRHHQPDSARLTEDDRDSPVPDRREPPTPQLPSENTERSETEAASPSPEKEPGEEPRRTAHPVQFPPAGGMTAGAGRINIELQTSEPAPAEKTRATETAVFEQPAETSPRSANDTSGVDDSGVDDSGDSGPCPGISLRPQSRQAPANIKFPAASAPVHAPQSTASSAPTGNSVAAQLVLPARRRSLTTVTWRLLIVMVTTAILISAVTGFGSNRESDIYDRVSGIYAEWQQHRNGETTASWPEFTARSRVTIDDSLPWLEEHAEPGNRDHSLLLFASRDLRDILKHPPDVETAHEERLKGFFRQLEEIYTDAR
ncbi:MAG: hypothetical protein VB858_07055 [Planctomycetaceae bacterium]